MHDLIGRQPIRSRSLLETAATRFFLTAMISPPVKVTMVISKMPNARRRRAILPGRWTSAIERGAIYWFPAAYRDHMRAHEIALTASKSFGNADIIYVLGHNQTFLIFFRNGAYRSTENGTIRASCIDPSAPLLVRRLTVPL
jgi:hypothetical protein